MGKGKKKKNAGKGKKSAVNVYDDNTLNQLLEEGKRLFNKQRYWEALGKNEEGLENISEKHPLKAAFHCNSAACYLMASKPIRYDIVIDECNFALKLQPNYWRAHLLRAKAYAALAEQESAKVMEDVQLLVTEAEADGLDEIEASNIVKQLKLEIEDFESSGDANVQNVPNENGMETKYLLPPCKEVEKEDWLIEFAELFRTHVGFDPDACIDLDLNKLGVDSCSNAFEEMVTSEEARRLFDKVAHQFQEVAALALFNLGNVHMYAATKRMLIDGQSSAEITAEIFRLFEELKQGNGAQGDSGIRERTPEEEKAAIHLLLGNLLFERSQIEFKLSLPGRKKNHDDAVEQFKLAGASEASSSTVLKNR